MLQARPGEKPAGSHFLEHALQVVRQFGDRVVAVREEVRRLLGQKAQRPPTPLTVVYFPGKKTRQGRKLDFRAAKEKKY